MEEAFLHFIWKFQHFTPQSLTAADGQEIVVFHQGTRNSDAGPDFLNARIKIGDITWNGHVEIHPRASDWTRHGHQQDQGYGNVILHVVWENDAPAVTTAGSTLPALVLKDRVNLQLYQNYKKLLEPADDILCRSFIGKVKPLTLISMADRAAAQRLQSKAESVLRELAMATGDWEEVSWRMLCKNFGFKTNADTFYELGKSLPFKILKKEAANQTTVEALLFGQAGFLDEDPADEYQTALQAEYLFKAKKYTLEKRLLRHRWKFLRLRPPNFPTIRIAQLASVVCRCPNLFSLFTAFEVGGELNKTLSLRQSEYWTTHYDFGEKTAKPLGNLGKASIQNIQINTVAPLLFAWGIHRDDDEAREKALWLLSGLPAEANNIIAKWTALGVKVNSAFDSQAFLEIYREYCLRKNCLQCGIGAEIIREG